MKNENQSFVDRHQNQKKNPNVDTYSGLSRVKRNNNGTYSMHCASLINRSQIKSILIDQ
ncbi:MAG: hypothetical protein ACI90V_003430 [Bacillariaceae sp.]|jgi:hypothetical protein